MIIGQQTLRLFDRGTACPELEWQPCPKPFAHLGRFFGLEPAQPAKFLRDGCFQRGFLGDPCLKLPQLAVEAVDFGRTPPARAKVVQLDGSGRWIVGRDDLQGDHRGDVV